MALEAPAQQPAAAPGQLGIDDAEMQELQAQFQS